MVLERMWRHLERGRRRRERRWQLERGHGFSRDFSGRAHTRQSPGARTGPAMAELRLRPAATSQPSTDDSANPHRLHGVARELQRARRWATTGLTSPPNVKSSSVCPPTTTLITRPASSTSARGVLPRTPEISTPTRSSTRAKGGCRARPFTSGYQVPDKSLNPGCYDNNAGAQSQEWEAFDLLFTRSSRATTASTTTASTLPATALAHGWRTCGAATLAVTTPPPLDQPDVDAGRTERKFAPHWAIRAHATAVSGALPPNQPQPCNGPSAGFWIHGSLEVGNLIAANIAALNLSLASNGLHRKLHRRPQTALGTCCEAITGLQGGVCQQYTGCPTGRREAVPAGLLHAPTGRQDRQRGRGDPRNHRVFRSNESRLTKPRYLRSLITSRIGSTKYVSRSAS